MIPSFRGYPKNLGNKKYFGYYYEFYVSMNHGKCNITIANSFHFDKSDIDRDDAWKRRIELKQVLTSILIKHKKFNLEITNQVILCLLTKLYMIEFRPELSSTEVLYLFHKNTQRKINHVVWEYSKGKNFNSKYYSEEGVFASDYSHIELFGWIYWSQINAILSKDTDCELTLVDLGVGGANFILTAIHVLRQRKLNISKIKFVGVDKKFVDLGIGLKILKEYKGVNFSYWIDDIASPDFNLRLSKLNPDIIIANHLIEHLPIKNLNSFILNWYQLASRFLSVSVPLENCLKDSISDHFHVFTSSKILGIFSDLEKSSSVLNFKKSLSQTNSGLMFFEK